MKLLKEATEEKKFDIRVVEKNITRGLTRADEYQKFLKELPDEAANAEWVNVEELHNQEESGNGASSVSH
jgi:hypothetical protein